MFRHITLSGALCLALSGAASAQPDTATKSSIAVAVLPHAEDALRLKVELLHADVSQSLKIIAARGGLQVLVKDGVKGRISNFTFSGLPERALALVCETARISGEWRNNVWMVSPEPPAPHLIPRVLDATQYRNFDTIGLLGHLAHKFNLRVAFTADVSNQPLPVLSFENLTPRQAIEVLALAAGAKVTEQKDGTLLLSDNGDAKPVLPAPPEAKTEPDIEQPTGRFLLIAPPR